MNFAWHLEAFLLVFFLFYLFASYSHFRIGYLILKINNMALYLLGVGGTGMRFRESFVHLCAIGMFADKEIKIVTIDTDAANGNKRRAEERDLDM